VKDTFSSSLDPSGYNQGGYLQGGAGGSLNLAVSAAILNGQVYGSVLVGEKQSTLASAPAGASVSVNGITPLQASSTFTTNFFDADQIVVSDAAAGVSAAWLANFNIGNDLNGLFTSNAAPANSVYLPTSWLNSGVANVGLGANSKISVPAGNAITLPTGGKFTANANTLDIESSIIAPSGTIALTGDYTGASLLVDSPSAHVNPNRTVSAVSSLVTIGSGVNLSTAGEWVNDRGGAIAPPIAIDGGTINIASYGDFSIGQGSVLDVSGGGRAGATGKIQGGSGGALTLTAGVKPSLIPTYSGPPLTFAVVSRGHIDFVGGLNEGQLRGYGLAGSSISGAVSSA
jgi:hypothetical protein